MRAIWGLLGAFILLLGAFSSAQATCSAVPFIFSAGATISAAQFNSDFAALVSCINSIDASQVTTGTLPVARGGTGATTSTGSGAVVLATSPTISGTLSTGTILAGSQANRLGTSSGDSTSPTHLNTNLLLYDISATNWSGIGASTSGSMYFVTGLIAPATRIVLDVSGNLQLTRYGAGALTTDAGGNVSATVGVSCAGSPTGLFTTSSNGIVTHC